MSRKSSKTKSAPTSAGWNGFINYSLGKTDKEKIKMSMDTPDELLAELQKHVEGGLNLKVSWDDYSDCVSAMFIGSEKAGGDAGWGVSCRHTDVYVALAGLLYMRRTFTGEDGAWLKPSEIGSEYDW
jgi:hypothetical protein